MLPDGTMNPEITGLKWGDDLDWEKALFGHGHRQEYSVSGGLRHFHAIVDDGKA